MRSGEGKHTPQIRDIRRAGYASDFAGSLSLFRQTFLNVLFLEHPLSRVSRGACGQTAMGNGPYFGVSRSESGAEADSET